MADSQRKTANLFDKDSIELVQITAQGDLREGTVMGVLPQNTYTISGNKSVDATRLYITKITNGTYSTNEITGFPYSFQADGTSTYELRTANQTVLTWESRGYTNVMVNEGSTPLPYEPYGWVHSLRKLGTSTDTITTLPADLYADGTNATVGLKGQMVQSSTPSPTTPIQPQETGERTGNLYFKSLAGCSIDATGKLTGNSQFMCYVAKVEANKTYIGEKGYVYAFFDTEPVSGSQSYNSQRVTENARDGITSPINGYVAVRFNTGTTEAMLSEGTTILPYEPYGYKIPILNNSQTTNVYLGEVQSTRRVKRLVFDGTEPWNAHATVSNLYTLNNVSDYLHAVNPIPICSHYPTKIVATAGAVGNNELALYYNRVQPSVSVLYIKNTEIASADDFKTYLQQQYAAGTPVTVWYVLATETTGIVNEPLRKIGDYADTISGITIPTITGKDTFDVQTTLKPSEVSLTYTGWHDATVKEWDGSEWQ